MSTAEMKQLEAAGGTATSAWLEPTLVNIQRDELYLVQTNGAEWRDQDMFVWTGMATIMRLQPNIVLGRPIRVARIYR